MKGFYPGEPVVCINDSWFRKQTLVVVLEKMDHSTHLSVETLLPLKPLYTATKGKTGISVLRSIPS